MRQRKLKAYWKRLGELVARDRAGRVAAGLVRVTVTDAGTLTYVLERAKLRTARQREGRYLLRTNLRADDPALVWRCYMQLVAVEEAFRTLKGDLGLRPIFHHKAERIEAHLFVAFLAYCLSTTLRQRLRAVAGGLMPRVVFEKLATEPLLWKAEDILLITVPCFRAPGMPPRISRRSGSSSAWKPHPAFALGSWPR